MPRRIPLTRIQDNQDNTTANSMNHKAANTTSDSRDVDEPVCVFTTRKMPVRLRSRMKALGIMLDMTQQDIIFACLEGGMPSLSEDAGLDWNEVVRWADHFDSAR